MVQQIQLLGITPEALADLIDKRLDKRFQEVSDKLQIKRPKKYITRYELADMLSIDLSTIHNWRKRNIIEAVQIGGKVYFERAEVEKAIVKLKTKAMATFKRQTYKYKETNIGKYKTVKHYSLEFTTDKVLRLSKKIKISKDQDFAKSTPCYWIELHNGKKFIKPRLTGLFRTKLSYIYYGDVGTNNRKEHTLLFRFLKTVMS